MDLYHAVLFIHIVGAILLVGGSFAADYTGYLARRAETVDTMRGHAKAVAFLSKVIPMFAVVVLASGLYMAFDAGFWSDGWLPVSLALFVAAGAVAGAVIDPAAKRMVAALEDVPSGRVTPEIAVRVIDPKLSAGGMLLGAIDVAIVFLMTNKPGYVGAGVVTAIALAVGLGLVVREQHHARTLATAVAQPVEPA